MPIDLQQRISAGQFAERHLGRDRASGRELLVTIPRLNGRDLNDEAKARILAAVRRYKGLIHPHVCSLVEVGFAESGQLVIAQEPPRGLAERPEPGAATEGVGFEALVHICEGLAYAHARNMTHGALTRDCVIIDGPNSAWITDFGVAAALYQAGVLAIRAEAAPEAAPEVKGGGEPTHQSDVYSLGVIGIGLCSGETTTAPTAPRELMQRARRVPGAGLATALGRAVELESHARFSTAEEMLTQLRALSAPRAAGAQAAPARRRPRPKPAPARRKAPEPSPEPEMGGAKALGLLLWTMLRSLMALALSLALIAAAVAGGLALAFRDTPGLVTVPDLTGRSLAQATTMAEAKKLRVAIGRETHHNEVPPNHVIEHSPYPGKVVREGRTLELVVSLGPARTKVPSLVGKSQAEAKKLLEAAGLRLGAVSRDQRSQKPNEEVLSQNPASEKDVAVNTEVNIMVSANRGKTERPERSGPRAADVTIIVPQGPVVQRVKVEVHYPSGRYTVAYERVHRPGDKVKTHVAASGEATVHVLIDGKVVREVDLEP